MAHVLLIDDDPVVVPEQARQAFPAPRYRVEVAGTGAEGLERIGAGPPDVILLDLRLPDQSGLEVYRQIRQIDTRIPVIFVTLAKTADAAIEAMSQGAVSGPQLRGHPGNAAGERAVRPREGRVHGRRSPPHRQVRAGERRDSVPRRDRRHAAGLAG